MIKLNQKRRLLSFGKTTKAEPIGAITDRIIQKLRLVMQHEARTREQQKPNVSYFDAVIASKVMLGEIKKKWHARKNQHRGANQNRNVSNHR